MQLAKGYNRERFEAACARALAIGARNCRSVVSILKTNADLARHRHDDRNRPGTAADGPAIAHDSIRDPTYFHVNRRAILTPSVRDRLAGHDRSFGA